MNPFEKKKDAKIIAPVAEKPPYDFAFIARSLGLIPIDGIAFNQGAVAMMECSDNGVLLVVDGEHEIELSHDQANKLQAMILTSIEAMEKAKSGKAPAIVLPDFVMKGK